MSELIISVLMFGFSLTSFGIDNCAGWDLEGTYFQPEKSDLSSWIPKDLFDRTIVLVDSVSQEDGLYSAILKLDKPMPNTNGRAKIVVNGKPFCFVALSSKRVPHLELTKEMSIIWTDEAKTFDAQSLKSELVLFRLRKRD